MAPTHLVDYSTEDIKERVRAPGPRGRGRPTVVYDPVGGRRFRCQPALASPGRAASSSSASPAARVPQIPAKPRAGQELRQSIGFYWGSYRKHDPGIVRQSYQHLFEWFGAGKLKPHISARLSTSPRWRQAMGRAARPPRHRQGRAGPPGEGDDLVHHQGHQDTKVANSARRRSRAPVSPRFAHHSTWCLGVLVVRGFSLTNSAYGIPDSLVPRRSTRPYPLPGA